MMIEKLELADSMNRHDIPMDTVYWMGDVYNYFINNGQPNERMLANYMMGCVYRDKGDAMLTMKYFREAVAQADTTSANCDYGLLYRIYGQMALLFMDTKVPSMAIDAEKIAYNIALQAGDTLEAINYLEMLGGTYHLLNKFDSALVLSNLSKELYEKNGYTIQASRALSVCIDIYLKEGNVKEAQRAMAEFEQKSQLFSNGNIQYGHEGYYAYKGRYFELVEDYDSASFYYNKLAKEKNLSNDLKVEAYKGLVSVYKKTRKTDSLAKYSNLLASAVDTMLVENSSKEIVRMQSVYNYKEQQRIAENNSTEAYKYKMYIMAGAVFSILLLSLIAFLARRWRQKTRQCMIEETKRYTHYLNKYNEACEEMKLLKTDSEAYKKNKEEYIQSLEQTISQYQNDKLRPKQWNIEQEILNSTIVKRFHELANHGLSASSVEWDDLNLVIEERMPAFYEHIRAKKYNLTEQEANLCVLLRLRFVRSELSILVG